MGLILFLAIAGGSPVIVLALIAAAWMSAAAKDDAARERRMAEREERRYREMMEYVHEAHAGSPVSGRKTRKRRVRFLRTLPDGSTEGHELSETTRKEIIYV